MTGQRQNASLRKALREICLSSLCRGAVPCESCFVVNACVGGCSLGHQRWSSTASFTRIDSSCDYKRHTASITASAGLIYCITQSCHWLLLVVRMQTKKSLFKSLRGLFLLNLDLKPLLRLKILKLPQWHQSEKSVLRSEPPSARLLLDSRDFHQTAVRTFSSVTDT